MISLLASSSIVAIGNQVQVEAIDGVAPYAYTLPDGGDGGSITSDGLYRAPLSSLIGSQKILVTDASSQTAEIEISILNYLQLVCYIIQKQLKLENDQAYIYNQKIDIPPDERLYIAVGVNAVKVFGSSMKMVDGIETLSTNSQMELKIDVISKSLEALNRKEEVISSFKSILSQRVQNANMFKLADLPSSFNDLSSIEGSAIPYRFNISLNMLYSVKVVQEVDSYEGSDMLPDVVELVDDGAILDTSGDII